MGSDSFTLSSDWRFCPDNHTTTIAPSTGVSSGAGNSQAGPSSSSTGGNDVDVVPQINHAVTVYGRGLPSTAALLSCQLLLPTFLLLAL